MRRRPPRLVSAACALVACGFVAAGGVVAALGSSVNEATVTVELDDAVTWYRYGTGTHNPVTPATGDTYDDTTLLADGTVVLSRWIEPSDVPNTTTVPWWNTDRRARQCVTAT